MPLTVTKGIEDLLYHAAAPDRPRLDPPRHRSLRRGAGRPRPLREEGRGPRALAPLRLSPSAGLAAGDGAAGARGGGPPRAGAGADREARAGGRPRSRRPVCPRPAASAAARAGATA